MRRLLARCGMLLFAVAFAGPAWPGDGGTVTLAFVGDVMLAETPGRVIRSGRDPLAPFADRLAAADVRIGNLECVVSDKGRADPAKPYSFRAHPRSIGILRRHFDAVSLANNHSGDYGPAAFADMLARLEGAGIAYFGGGRTLAAAHRPWIIEKRGIRIALLGYNEFFPRWFEADFDRAGVAWSEDEQVRLDIERARRNERADIVIPFMHWGWEGETRAGERQRRLARLMIEAGADAVIGGHPHVVQDIEIYKGRPVIYSLGNFVFDGFEAEETTTGWLVTLAVDRQGARDFRVSTARIDREGIPHPRTGGQEFCWARGQDAAARCATN